MPEEAPSVERRRRAAVAGHLGNSSEAARSLSDHDPAVRATALRALGRMGDLHADQLKAALEDAAPAVRMAALELAASRRDVAAAFAGALLDDDDAQVVETAAWACGEKASAADRDDDATGAVDAVVARLVQTARGHEDALCRESAVAALGAIGHRGGLAAVLAGLTDKPAVRRRAVIALAAFEGPEVEEALALAGRDRDRQVRAAAAELGFAGSEI